MALKIYESSILKKEGIRYYLARNEKGQKVFCVEGDSGTRFQGNWHGDLLIGPLSDVNINHLRRKFAWLKPVPLGLQTSAGTGDRLGCATPGHIAAFNAVDGNIAPIFAQQSMRENARTFRTPRKVMDDAAWGVFQAGWRKPWGADADHLKTLEDVTICAKAGYTFFTVDPFDYVDNEAADDEQETLKEKFQALPWETLNSSPEKFIHTYIGQTLELAGNNLIINEENILRAACKYGAAIAHANNMFNHTRNLISHRPFEMEISVDETESPTTPIEHYLIVNELKRLGVEFVSLAPRFIGRFEKGVDYIGDLQRFERELALHTAIQKLFGDYKISIHSGSDKFSIYPLFAKYTQGKVHLKTAGTSFLEALRVFALTSPSFFRQIMQFALQRYEHDRRTYHVSAKSENVPDIHQLKDRELPELLNHFDARQVLHVTYGSVMETFGGELLAKLDREEAVYTAVLKDHFINHLKPFTQ